MNGQQGGPPRGGSNPWPQARAQQPAPQGYPQQPGYPPPGYQGYPQQQPQRDWASFESRPVNLPAPSNPATAREIGLFDAVPCPVCGTKTHTRSVGSIFAQQFGGVVGMLIHGAVAANYTCPTHGMIPLATFPPNHRSAIQMRRFLKLGIAGMLVMFVIALLILRAVLLG